MTMQLRLTRPFPKETLVQKFGQNDINYSTIDAGLKGHPGQDYQMPWGTPIPAAANGAICSAILSKDNPNLMAFRAVNTIIDFPDVSYEIQYGHCSEIHATVGSMYEVGDIVANIGNTGPVYVNGVEVTQAEKAAGSHAGSHLHLQVRVLNRVPASNTIIPGVHYLNDGAEILTLKGYHYQVPNWNNGYNGCVDPEQFFVDSQTIPSVNEAIANLDKPSDKVAVIAAQAQASGNSTVANILWKIVAILTSFIK